MNLTTLKHLIGITLVGALVPLFSLATAGQEKGGGNVYEAEFKQIGRELLGQMENAGLSSKQLGFELVNFRVALQEVRVLATDGTLEVNNIPRMAINSPKERLIMFSNSTWQILTVKQKRLLVLHEYLRFVGVDDSEYTYSLNIMALVQRGGGSSSTVPALSSRAQKLRVGSGGRILSTQGPDYFGKSTHIIASCNDFFKKVPASALVISGNSKSSKYFNKMLDEDYSLRREKCAAMKSIIDGSSDQHPLTVIIDPLKALADREEVLNFAF